MTNPLKAVGETKEGDGSRFNLDRDDVIVTGGLLGAKIDLAKLDLIGPRYITDCRLEEIERRILSIEETLWPLGR